MLISAIARAGILSAVLASTALSAYASQTTLGKPSILKPITGQPVTITATVKRTGDDDEKASLQGGIVELYDGTTLIGSELLVEDTQTGIATTTFTFNDPNEGGSLDAGQHKLKAVFRADLGPSGLTKSESRFYGVSIKRATLSTTLVLPSPRLPFGEAVTLKATFAVAAPSVRTANGTVLFLDGTKKLGTVKVTDALEASLVVKKLAYGPHQLSARFEQNKNFDSSVAPGIATNVDFSRGSEYEIIGETGGEAGNPATFYNLASGGALVAFDSLKNGKLTTFLQFVDKNGVPVGKPGTIPAGTAGGNPAITVNRNLEYLVAFEAGTAPKRSIDVRLFDARGEAKGRYTFGGSGDSSNAALASTIFGDPVVVYQTTTAKGDGNGSGIAFAVSGTQNVYVVANTTTAGDQINPAVQLLTSGVFAVAWSSPVDGGFAPFFQIIDDTGVKLGDEIQVAPAQSYPPKPVLMAGEDGGVLVAWDKPDAVGSPRKDAVIARFKADGTKIGNIARLDTRGTGDQSDPALFLLGADKLGTAWAAPDADRAGIWLQVFSKTGSRIQSPGLVNFGSTAGVQSDPALTLIGPASVTKPRVPDSFIVVWRSKVGTDPATIRLQKFKTP